MMSTDGPLADIKTMLLGIEITLIGVVLGTSAVLFESGIAFFVAIFATGIGLVWTVSGFKETAE